MHFSGVPGCKRMDQETKQHISNEAVIDDSTINWGAYDKTPPQVGSWLSSQVCESLI